MNSSGDTNSLKARLGPWAGPLLVWSCLLLLPFGRSVEVVVFTMAFGGIFLLVKKPVKTFSTPAARLFAAAFLCVWIPIALSCIDAYNLKRSLVVAANHWRFLFSGLFILWALETPPAQQKFLKLCAWLLAFWVIDAMVQSIFGVDLLGREPWFRGTTALFGPDSGKFAVSLAVLTPLLWSHAHRAWPRWLIALLLPMTVFAVLGGGSRAAWVMLAVVTGCYLTALAVRSLRAFVVLSLAATLAIGLTAAAAYHWSPGFRDRVEVTVDEISGDGKILSRSLLHRAYIWRAAWQMYVNHPVNGVGARGFRYAYPDYASPDDPFYKNEYLGTPTHSHNLITELATETGTIGLAGYLALVLVLAAAAWRTRNTDCPSLMPYGVALIAAGFPVNTHWAIFSSYWSQIVWWLIALFCAAYGAKATGNAARPAKQSRGVI